MIYCNYQILVSKGKAMKRIKELDSLNAKEWSELLDQYLINTKDAAKELDVSPSRIFQYDANGSITSVVRGYYLRSEVIDFKQTVQKRRMKHRKRKDTGLSSEQVFQLFCSLYAQTQQAITPKRVIEEAEKMILPHDVVIKYRVASAIHILVRENKLIRIKYGFYIPVLSSETSIDG